MSGESSSTEPSNAEDIVAQYAFFIHVVTWVDTLQVNFAKEAPHSFAAAAGQNSCDETPRACRYQKLREEQRELWSRINNLEHDMAEHEQVGNNLEQLDGDRRCYRLIGGVLVERTVADVLPAVRSTAEHLQKVWCLNHDHSIL